MMTVPDSAVTSACPLFAPVLVLLLPVSLTVLSALLPLTFAVPFTWQTVGETPFIWLLTR